VRPARGAIAVDVRRHARQVEEGDVLHAEAPQDLAGHRRRVAQVVGREAGGRDTGDAHQLAERPLELAEALLDGPQGRRPVRSPLSLHLPPGDARGLGRSPLAAIRYITAVGGAGSSGAPAFERGRRDR